MPNEVFFDLLGLPSARAEGRARLGAVGARAQGPQARRRPAHPGGQGRHGRIGNYFVDLLHERRARPRNDLVTHLVTADIDGVPFAEADWPASEVLGLMMVLFLGGVESTAGLTGTSSSCSPRTPGSGRCCARTRR